MKKTQILIIGGGASGLTAAISAKRNANVSVTVLEKEERIAEKLLVTGNGKCNFANENLGTKFYYQNQDFLEQVNQVLPPEKGREFLFSLGLPSFADGSGRLYPYSRRASAVSDALRLEIERLGVEVLSGTAANSIERKGEEFLVNGEIPAKRLILALGGRAGLRKRGEYNAEKLASGLGIRCHTAYPALCALKLGKPYSPSLKGVRHICQVELSENGKPFFQEAGEIQFNEMGVSGIPILQSSLPASDRLSQGKNLSLTLDLLKDIPMDALIPLLQNRARRLSHFPAENLFTGFLPKMLYLFVLKQANLSPNEKLKTDTATVQRLARQMKYQSFPVIKTADFKEAQISGGGFLVQDFFPQTLEHRKIQGLYACGEAMDIQGVCGGYNLNWAWCSGLLAGEAAAKSL